MFISNLSLLKYSSCSVLIHFYIYVYDKKLFFIIEKIFHSNLVRLFRKFSHVKSIPLILELNTLGNSLLLGHHFHCAEQESSLDPVKQVISNTGI